MYPLKFPDELLTIHCGIVKSYFLNNTLILFYFCLENWVIPCGTQALLMTLSQEPLLELLLGPYYLYIIYCTIPLAPLLYFFLSFLCESYLDPLIHRLPLYMNFQSELMFYIFLKVSL